MADPGLRLLEEVADFAAKKQARVYVVECLLCEVCAIHQRKIYPLQEAADEEGSGNNKHCVAGRSANHTGAT